MLLARSLPVWEFGTFVLILNVLVAANGLQASLLIYLCRFRARERVGPIWVD